MQKQQLLSALEHISQKELMYSTIAPSTAFDRSNNRKISR